MLTCSKTWFKEENKELSRISIAKGLAMKLTYVISVAYASIFVLPWLSIETLWVVRCDENKCVGCLMCAGFVRQKVCS